MKMTTGVYTHHPPDSPPNFVVLHCSACGSNYSANRGDYFLHPSDKPLKCGNDGFKLFIVTRRTVLDHDKGREWLQFDDTAKETR